MLLRPEVGTQRRGVFQSAVEVGADHWLVAVITNRQRFTDDRYEPLQVLPGCLNKMARTMWAMLTKNEDYRVPAQAETA